MIFNGNILKIESECFSEVLSCLSGRFNSCIRLGIDRVIQILKNMEDKFSRVWFYFSFVREETDPVIIQTEDAMYVKHVLMPMKRIVETDDEK